MKDLHVKLLVVGLIVAGAALAYFKVTRLGLPLRPSEQAEVWTVEARIEFEVGRGPTKVAFFIPQQPPGFAVLDEDFISSNYGLATEDDGVNRKALWALRKAKGKQVLYYRIQLAEALGATPPRTKPRPAYPPVPDYEEPDRSAILALLEQVRSESADIVSFTRELLIRLNDPTPDENVSTLRDETEDELGRVRSIVRVLAGARIPARVVYVLRLQGGLRHGALTPWVEVFNDQEWLVFNPVTGESGYPRDALVWHAGDDPLATVKGDPPVDVQFSVARTSRALVAVAEQRARQIKSHIMEYSLFGLPVQTQNVYRILLLVPLGAFIVVILRNLIGIKTFGTFMPILIALAFRETELLWGIILFTLVVALGLALRFYLETLKLLLVPRLASVLIIVILLMASISLLSHKLGLEQGLSVALFPMVILAMTIERMSLIWEENGPAEALTQGLGTLFAASLGYLVMSSDLLRHLVFVFPELLLVLLAFTVLMGRYTGYRLSELWRFRAALRVEDKR